MDLTHPVRAMVPTLDGPVMEVLARTTRPLTGREVHRLAGVGSASGTRLALGRLVTQGLVHAEDRSSGTFYRANRDHLAWPAVQQLAGLRTALLDRLKGEVRLWKPRPVHASLFGSAARGDGGAESDIDILLVRPDGIAEDESPWADQVDNLRRQVRAWTGNACQAFEVDLPRLEHYRRVGDPLITAFNRDGITLTGPDVRSLLSRTLAGGDH